MKENLENLINSFYKTYYKIEEISLDNTIKCLTQNEIHVINIIGRDTITINDLAERLGITMGTVSTAINKLEKKNFVVRKKIPEDKRKVFVSLTKKGEIAYNFHGKFHSSIIEKISEGISDPDLEVFVKVFEKMYQNLLIIKKDYEPVILSNLKIGETALVDEVKLNDVVLRYLSEKGFVIGREILVLEKTDNSLTLKLGKLIRTISIEEAKGIYCIKKGN